MRRTVFKQFVMNKDEAADLASKAQGACMSEGRLIRMLVSGYVPPPAPDDRFYEEMEQIRAFSDRLQQIAAATSDDDMQNMLIQEIIAWQAFRLSIQEHYLGREAAKYQWL